MGVCPSRAPEHITPAQDGVIRVGSNVGLRIVCISDTHARHRELRVPPGDILIHAGDFTQFGKEDQANDFDDWLSGLPHMLKIVVLGNHENNSPWHGRAAELLSHATFLRNSGHTTPQGLRIFGTDFYWPCQGRNPYFDAVLEGVDILVAHGPARGCADGGRGCAALLDTVRRLQPQLVVSGHIHYGHGAVRLKHHRGKASTLLVNAANCGSGKDDRSLVHPAVIVEL